MGEIDYDRRYHSDRYRSKHRDIYALTEIFTHSQYISQKSKDAICDRFREKTGVRPSVDLDNPTLRLHLHVSRNRCIIALDSSGDSLHKRGYREKTNLRSEEHTSELQS